MAQHTIDLAISIDTYIDYYNPSSSFGSSTTLKSGGTNRAVELGWRRFDYVAMLRWPMPHPDMPNRKKLISAKMHLYQSGGAANVDFTIYSPETYYNNTWDESTTWNNIPEEYKNILAGSTLGVGQYVEIDLCATDPRHNLYADGNLRILGAASNGESSGVITWVSNNAAANKPFIRVTYEDVPPNAPTPTEPIGLYKDSKSATHFGWQYNSDVGGTQKAFDLQWSIDQSTWTTVSETTANNYYDMPADTLPAGNIYWRIRCYNEYDEVGPYCDIQSFYAIGAPNAPAINAIPTDTARPTVSWSAFSQQVYQLQVLSDDSVVYDSSVVPGINTRSHKIPTWLADGEYAVQMRIKNEYDMWSDWGAATATISTAKPDKPSLTLQRSAHGVEISATGIVYRSDYDKDDYICIGTASGTYFDNTVKNEGEYKYFVRAISENDTYNDSDIKFIQAELRHALIAPVSDLTNVFAFTRSLNAPPKRTYNRQPGGAFVEYAGRKSPVWEPTEHVSAGWSMTFFLKTWAEVETFTEIYDLNSTVLYRDAKGRKMYGTLSNLSVNDDILGYIISFTLSQVDYTESVEV